MLMMMIWGRMHPKMADVPSLFLPFITRWEGGGAVMRVVQVEPHAAFKIWVRFDEGTSRTIDLQELSGRGVLDVWEDRRFLESMHINDAGAVEWPCDVNLCPDSLYFRVTGKSPEDLFPDLRTMRSDA